MSVTWHNHESTMMKSLIIQLHLGKYHTDDSADMFFYIEHISDTGPSVLILESTVPQELKNTNKLFEQIKKANGSRKSGRNQSEVGKLCIYVNCLTPYH